MKSAARTPRLCLPRVEKPERWEVNEGSGEEQFGLCATSRERKRIREMRDGGGEKIEKQGGERGWFENVIFLPALA